MEHRRDEFEIMIRARAAAKALLEETEEMPTRVSVLAIKTHLNSLNKWTDLLLTEMEK